MTVYVDELRTYPNTPLRYKTWCHMACDGEEAELHQMAQRIGLRRAWYQDKNPRLAHYDLTPSRRVLAISEGAISVDGMERAETLGGKGGDAFMTTDQLQLPSVGGPANVTSREERQRGVGLARETSA